VNPPAIERAGAVTPHLQRGASDFYPSVVYIYNDTREGDMIWSILENFRGVLVSGFYSVYDSIDCPQQKCLIHLIRDINDDLHKHPFDEDLGKIAQAFAGLLQPMIRTIDKRGLNKRFLSRYQGQIEKYYSWIRKAQFASEVSAGYQRRFSKYRNFEHLRGLQAERNQLQRFLVLRGS
jgi:hypothetical protein